MSPFRELFNELPAALFDMLQGIGEEAIKRAQATSEPHRGPSATSTFISATNNAFLGDWLCERFGWKSVEVWRSEVACRVEFGVVLLCGHRRTFPLPEMLLESTPTINIADLIADAWERAGRRCYCVSRWS